MPAAIKTLQFYQNGRVTTELRGTVARSIFQHKGCLLAQRTSGTELSSSIMAVSDTNSVMTELEHTGVKHHPYSPYGQRPTHNELNDPMAFNGQKLDLATGGYLLGNGYRLFSPALNRFCGPDNLSPFERGGLNTYAYCAGDPVNRTDPSGHAYSPGSALVSVLGATSVIVGSVILAAENGKNSTSMKILGGILIAGGGFVLSMQAIDLLSTRNTQRVAATLFNQRVHGTAPNLSANSVPPPGLNSPLGLDSPLWLDSPPAYDALFGDLSNSAELPPPTYASAVGTSQLNYNPQPTRHQAPQGLDSQAEHRTAIRTGEPPGRRHSDVR